MGLKELISAYKNTTDPIIRVHYAGLIRQQLAFKDSGKNYICKNCKRKFSHSADLEMLIEHEQEHSMVQAKIWQGTTKGELMKICYNNNESLLRNVDVALPQSWLDENPGSSYWFVMDYNKNTIFGEVRNLKDVAKENGVKLIYP